MRKIWEVSRRRFLALLAAGGLRVTAASGVPATPASGFRVLDTRQVEALEAITEQIIPADTDPGARETGVVRYIDRVLAGEQREKRALYAAGLAGANETSAAMFGRDFVKLTFDQQTMVLKAIERGEVKGESWKQVSGAQFFSMIWTHTLEGFYGPPSHGGNKNHASWKMIGYPIEH